jgi:TRAP-type C4-dicarboxylate transport system permease small subunit
MVDIKEEEGKSTRTLVIEVIIGLVSASFAFVAALAWNTAIQKAIEQFFSADDLVGVFIYAIVVTIIAVIVILGLARLLAKYKAQDRQKQK